MISYTIPVAYDTNVMKKKTNKQSVTAAFCLMETGPVAYFY